MSEPEPLPPEAYYDYTAVGGVSVSPSGDRAAFVAVESDPDEEQRRRSVFVVPTDGSREPHRLTRVTDAGTPKWSPDGDRLAVPMAREEDVELRVGRAEDETDDESEETDEKSEGEDADGEDGGNGGDDEPKTQVWVYDLRLGGDARQVTDLEEGVSDFDWGPDGERIVVAGRDPTDDQREYLDELKEGGPVEIERLQHKFDGAGWLDEVRSYLFVVDVESRETERLDETGLPPSVGADLSPSWAPGERIAFCGYDPEAAGNEGDPDDTYASDVYTIAPDGTDRRRLTDGALSVSGPEWSPDGERLAFVGRYPENWYRPSEVFVADPGQERADAPGVAYESVSAPLDRTLGYGAPVRWLDEGSLLTLIGDEGRSRFARLHVDGEPERLPAAQNEYEGVTGADCSADGSTVACVLSRPQAGADLHAIDVADLDAPPVAAADRGTESDPRRRLTAVNEDLLATYEQPVCERLTVESEAPGDDEPTEVEVVAYRPPEFEPGDDPGKFLLWIHGGPMAYDQPGFRFMDGYFTSRGYTVWKVNYRGSTSYGRDFCEQLKGAWNGAEVADLLAAVDAAVDRGWADPDRLFVGGFSQGGVNTGYLVTRREFAAAAAEHGIYDLRSSFGTDDSHNWLEADYGVPWENPEGYEAASSIDDVGEVETPTLLTAGENDHRCPPSQAEQFYVSLRKRGVDSKLVIYQDEHHNVGDPDRAIHRLETLEGWFAEHDPAAGDESEDGDSESDGDA